MLTRKYIYVSYIYYTYTIYIYLYLIHILKYKTQNKITETIVPLDGAQMLPLQPVVAVPLL